MISSVKFLLTIPALQILQARGLLLSIPYKSGQRLLFVPWQVAQAQALKTVQVVVKMLKPSNSGENRSKDTLYCSMSLREYLLYCPVYYIQYKRAGKHTVLYYCTVITVLYILCTVYYVLYKCYVLCIYNLWGREVRALCRFRTTGLLVDKMERGREQAEER